MKLTGKIRAVELKDLGKGKDAEANDVLVMTAKLDGESGIRGKLYFEPGDDKEFALGDVIEIDVRVKQGRLKLTGSAGAKED